MAIELTDLIAEKEKTKEDSRSLFRKISDLYFAPKSFEKWGNGRIYELLGVRAFKKILPTTGNYVSNLIGYHPILKSSGSIKDALTSYDTYTTKFAETVHLAFIPLLTHYMVEAYNHAYMKPAAFYLFLNLIGNIYPIMLQRYNRTRISNILGKMEARKRKK